MHRFERSLAVALAFLLSGCAAFMHGYTLERYTDRTLPGESEEGAYRLDLEAKVDLTIRNYIADHGTPDFLRVADMDTVYLYYLDEDLVAKFVRPWHDSNSRITPYRPIPSEQQAWLPRSAVEMLGAAADTASPTLEECFAKCRELTDRSKEQCFDVCRE